ncbi:glycoside hydrolase family 2 TIM barrel-domain containing protein, partial [Lachnospiraceae bacterium 45-W7]
MLKQAMKQFTGKLFMFLMLLGGVICIGWNTSLAYAAVVTGNEWTTPEDVRVGQTDARAIVIPYNDVESAKANPTIHLGKTSPNYIDLDGTWKFFWVSKPSEKPNVEGVTAIPDNYFDITVPSSWQTNMQYAGWKGTEIDWPIYNNQQYPWQSSGNGVTDQGMGNGSAAPKNYNPVGTYMRTVTIDAKDIGTQRFILTFLGVESGYYVYVNGQAVGYGEDSFTTSEYDITDYLKAGENLITVQVYHYTTGSYLENQDMIYYAGIHRDVFITKQPKVSIYDYNVETTFDDHNYDSGTLDLTVDVSNITDKAEVRKVRAYLYDGQGKVVSTVNGLEAEVNAAANKTTQAKFKANVAKPRLWSAELPNLYTLVMELCDSEGKTIQTVGKRIGFREFYIEGKGTNSEMRINGQNIEFYGVCRGESDPKGGHYVPYETIVKDVENAKQLNINSIRTSHFPPDPNLIELADEYGLYIMDEVNVETHDGRGSVTIPEASRYENTTGRLFPGNDKRYKNAMEDRMTSMVMRDKNNASVIIYSLGNETGSDASDRLAPDPQEGNFNRMIDIIKKLDGEKLIHYQGWVANQRVDIEGAMYPGHSPKIKDKPYIMMEYQHSMGNTGGDFEKYTDGFEEGDQAARYQGGFIWDYVDQSAYTPKNGVGGAGLTVEDLYFGFDGSWQQQGSKKNYNFCVNGFIFPDRSWSPQAYEIKYRYQDLKFTQTDAQKAAKKVTLKNFNRFKNANYYDIVWTVLEDGKKLVSGTFTDEEADLAPPQGRITGAAVKELTVPYEIADPKAGAEYILQLEYRLKDAGVYAEKGYVQGSEQFEIDVKGTDKLLTLKSLPNVQTKNEANEVTVTGTTKEGKAFTVTVNKESGLMTAYQVDGKDLISRAPVGSFFRAEPDQNTAIAGVGWVTKGEAYDAWCDQGEGMTDVSVKVSSVVPQMTKVSVAAKLKNGSDYATSYSIYGNGTVVVTAKLVPSDSAPSQLGEYGMWMQVPQEFEHLTWYGRGPSETYWNRKAGNMVGVWEGTVTEQFVPYLRVQEAGNKTDVRWMALQNDEGTGLLAGMTYGEGYTGEPLEAVALHYTAKALSSHQSKIRYPYQAQKTDDVVLRLLTHQKGVGNIDWGTEPLTAVINKTDTELLDYSYTLMPLFADTDPMEKSKEILEETPEIPAITSISLMMNGKKQVLSGFQADKTEYTVELPSNYEGFPEVSANGPSSLKITYKQATESSKDAVVTATYEAEGGLSSSTEYTIHFTEAASEKEVQLSSLVTIPAMTGVNNNSAILPADGGKLLYAYSGYGAINQDKSTDTNPLKTGPASAEKTYEYGFGGNTEQIIDIDISDQNAISFSGVGGIDWALKANNAKSTIKFEVWAHKNVGELTADYYNDTTKINPGIATRGDADWTAAGWVKLSESAEIVGNAAEPKHTFENVSLQYEEGGQSKSYQAIRLVMDVSNGSNSHDQGVWGDPRILCPTESNPGSGFEEPGEDFEEIKINGVALKGFSKDKKEYDVKISSGAKLPEVTATVKQNGGSVPVKISKVAVPGDVTISYDNGTPTTYTIHFTRDAAVEGTMAYLSDLVEIPELTGPDSVQNGNLLYGFSGSGTIYKDRSAGSGANTKLQLRKSGDGGSAEISTYEHGFAGAAQQVIDIDISSQNAGVFRADAGIDWAMKPDGGAQSEDGPTVTFEVWAHKNVALLNYGDTKMTADGKEQSDFAKEGWIKLAESPVMTNGNYSGTLETEKNLHSFNVDLTYLEGTQTKSYEALRLVMNPVDGKTTDDQGVWGDPRVEFIQKTASLMSVPVLGNANTEQDGVSVPVLLSNVDTSQDRIFHVILAAYDKDNRMAGCTVKTYNAKDTGSNVDETVTVNYDVQAVGETTLKFMIWDEAEPSAPLFGVFTSSKNGSFSYEKLPYVSGVSENPQTAIEIDPVKDTVTVIGTGFEPNSSLTLQTMYEKETGEDHTAQITADGKGAFRYTYTSNYDLEADSGIDAVIGGNGLGAKVKTTTKTPENPGREPVKNQAGAAKHNDKTIDVSSLEGLFIIDKNAGAAKYSVVPGGTAEAVMADDHKTLTVNKPGTVRIGLTTAQTATHASGKQVIAVLTVNNNNDRSALLTTIAIAKEKKEADYSADSYAALQAAVAEAERAAANPNAFQNKLDDTALAVLKAICELSPVGSKEAVDKKVVDAAVALAELKVEESYKAEGWAAMQTALAAAKAVTEETAVADVKTAAVNLVTAIGALEIETEKTFLQDFNAGTTMPEGWGKLEYNNNMMAIADVSTAPAGYPASVTGNALHAYGKGSGTRGGRIAYTASAVPKLATFTFDFYIKTAPSGNPNLLYLEQGAAVKHDNDTVRNTDASFFALADGMSGAGLQYYDYDAKSWKEIPGGSGKWLRAEVQADFSASKVSFAIKDGETVLAEVTSENAMAFADTVTTFNRITMACYRTNTTDCDVWIDNFAIKGPVETGNITVKGIEAEKTSVIVEKGTSLEEAKAALAELTFFGKVTDSMIPTFENPVSAWTIEKYDPQVPGTYRASASLELPEGFVWADGVSGAVEASVIVRDKTDKSELTALIEEAEGKNEAEYTEESWSVFADALKKAKAVEAKEDATQEEVEEAKETLELAMNGLKKKDPESNPADKSELTALIEEAEGKNEAEYTEESWSVFADALKKAKAVEAKEDATQEEVEEAKETLELAMNGL